MDLEPFATRPQCPKCHDYSHAFVYCTRSHAGQLALDETGQHGIEHLDVRCDGCGFIRYTKTADAQ